MGVSAGVPPMTLRADSHNEPWTNRSGLPNLLVGPVAFVHRSCKRGVSRMYLPRSVSRRSVLAVVAAGSIAALALPAGATTTTTTTPSHGSATSTLSILRVKLLGNSVTAGTIKAVAANVRSPHTARLVVTPLSYNFPAAGQSGTLGQQTITPGSPSSVPATPKTISIPGGLGSVTGPTFVAQATDSATQVAALAQLKALGKVTV